VKLIGVPWFEVDRAWGYLQDYVRKGIAPSGEKVTPDEIKEKCLNREYQLWVLFTDKVSGAGVSYLAQEDGELVAWVYALAGKGVLPSIIDAMEQFKEWAKSQNATRIRLRGRVGWTKIFPDWEVKDRFLELEI
jgi:hypothetical protein